MDESVATPTRTKAIMRKHNLSLKKSLGQNFLIDQNILQHIVQAAELSATSAVLEIGPGIGALTERLAQAAERVVAVEIDRHLLGALTEVMQPYEHVSIVHGDILKLDLDTLFDKHFAAYEEVNVVANLPYYVTTPIIMGLLEAKLPLRHIVVMIQKEVAERMAAQPGGKDYGSLSIAVQYYCEAELITTVPHTVFIPQPKVDSAVMRLKLRAKPAVDVADETHFFNTVRASFTQRRKTIFNNLGAAFFDKDTKPQLRTILETCDIDPSRRAETICLEQFARLSNALLQAGWGKQ